MASDIVERVEAFALRQTVHSSKRELYAIATEITKLRAELAACRAEKEGAVAVKPLVWEHSTGNLPGQEVWSSGDPWMFWIVKNPDKPEFIWCESFGLEGFVPASPVRGSFEDLASAKDAAQADYEARIRAALSQPSEPDGIGGGS